MGSGIFPLRLADGARLLQAAALIEACHDELVDEVYSGDSGGGQFDNAASDGGELALLQLAARLCREAVGEPSRGETW